MDDITPEDIEGGLPRNFLRPCLLLLLGEKPSHGYDLLSRLGDLGLRATDPGGLYRTLRAMEKEGLVDSRWETSQAGPARRTYEVAEEGREWLHAWAGALSESRRIISSFLERYRAIVNQPAINERDT